MAKVAYFASRISPNQFETPTEGYRICRSVRICRTGYQDYQGSELKRHPSYDPSWDLDDSETYQVFRPLDEVTSPQTIASFEGKTIVDEHPPDHIAPGSLISCETERELGCGHVQNVRVGAPLSTGETPLIADLYIKDGDLIDKIDAGVRDISCGYTYALRMLGDGSLAQGNILGNHIAVVPKGRAGRDISIMDAAPALRPYMEELIEDDGPAALTGHQQPPSPLGFFEGVATYAQGLRAYQAAMMQDAPADTSPSAFWDGASSYSVGRARYEAHLSRRVRR